MTAINTKSLLLKKLILAVGFLASAVMANQPRQIGFAVIYEVEESWQTVNQAIKEAILEEGIVISYTSHASDMLNRTAQSLGIDQTTYAHAEIHLFCKVDISQQMVKQNPHIIAGCPYGISVYELIDSPNKVYVSYRKLPAAELEPAYQPVEGLLQLIIESALDDL